jgi:hypothetical protein
MNSDISLIIISSALTAIIGPLIVHFVQLKTTRKKHDPITECLANDSLVINKMEEIKEEFSADRVWVEQFHNGGHFYPTGKSIQKFSMIYEVVSNDTFSIQANFQNIPISLFSKSMNQLLENDSIIIPDFKDDSIPTYGLKYTAYEMDCKSSCLVALKSIDGKFIGVLGMDFTKRKKVLTPEDISYLFQESALICGVLMNHLNS